MTTLLTCSNGKWYANQLPFTIVIGATCHLILRLTGPSISSLLRIWLKRIAGFISSYFQSDNFKFSLNQFGSKSRNSSNHKKEHQNNKSSNWKLLREIWLLWGVRFIWSSIISGRIFKQTLHRFYGQNYPKFYNPKKISKVILNVKLRCHRFSQ